MGDRKSPGIWDNFGHFSLEAENQCGGPSSNSQFSDLIFGSLKSTIVSIYTMEIDTHNKLSGGLFTRESWVLPRACFVAAGRPGL